MSLLSEYMSKRMGGKEVKALITFLKRTKEEKYARIVERSLAYPRVKEQRELNYNDEKY